MFKILKSSKFRKRAALVVLALIAVFALCSVASASQSMPWESPLEKVQKSIRGPVAKAISLCAIAACGIALVFGGDIQGFIRQGLYLVLVISIIMLASSFLSSAGISEEGSALIFNSTIIYSTLL